MKVGGRLCQDKLKQDGGKIYGSRPVFPKVILECLLFPWLRTTFSGARWQENKKGSGGGCQWLLHSSFSFTLVCCGYRLSLCDPCWIGTWYIDLDDFLPQFPSAKIIGECHTPICASALLKQTTTKNQIKPTNHPNNNETLAMMWRCVTERCSLSIWTPEYPGPEPERKSAEFLWIQLYGLDKISETPETPIQTGF